MVAYTVHEKPEPAVDRIDRAEELVFVKDGFHWLAALVPAIWFLANRMWLVLVAYLAVVIGLGFLVETFSLGEEVALYPILALNLLVGAEADSLKRWTLEQRNWQTVGTVVGRNWGECERRFFTQWLYEQPVLKTQTSESATMSHPSVVQNVEPDGAAGPVNVVTPERAAHPAKRETRPAKRRWSWSYGGS